MPQQRIVEHPDNGWLMPFPSEAEAVEYVARRIRPFCSVFTQERPLASGLRPDIGVRFRGMNIPIAIEVKQFPESGVVPFPEAIRQAADYARELGTAAFVAPLAGKGALQFQWNASLIGTGLLVGGQFGVGGLYFAHERYRDRPVGGLLLAGQTVAKFSRDENGEPRIEWHSNAPHLLKLKLGRGSASWRQ